MLSNSKNSVTYRRGLSAKDGQMHTSWQLTWGYSQLCHSSYRCWWQHWVWQSRTNTEDRDRVSHTQLLADVSSAFLNGGHARRTIFLPVTSTWGLRFSPVASGGGARRDLVDKHLLFHQQSALIVVHGGSRLVRTGPRLWSAAGPATHTGSPSRTVWGNRQDCDVMTQSQSVVAGVGGRLNSAPCPVLIASHVQLRFGGWCFCHQVHVE